MMTVMDETAMNAMNRAGMDGADRADGPNPHLSMILLRTFFLLTFVVVVVVAVSIIAISFTTYEAKARSELTQEAEHTAFLLNDLDGVERTDVLNGQTDATLRFTLIAPDGSVLYESDPASTTQENHANRPEVKEALNEGVSSASRFSNTLQTDTIYAATRLDDGSVIRLAKTRGSLFAFASLMIAPLLFTLALIVGSLILISRFLTRKIMRPLEQIDIAAPVPGRSYAEIIPTIDRINKQQLQLREQNEKLQRAEGLRRDFSANVSHEMKTPLHVISGYAELMAEGDVPPEKMKEFASLIYDEAQDMRRLIDDVLVLSRLDEPVTDQQDGSQQEMVAIDMLNVVSTAVARLQPLADERGVTLQVRGAKTFIRGDRALLDQMTMNLISNAIRYNKPNGTVDIEVAARGTYTVLRVSDTGIGIPDEDQEKIFQRFYRVDKSRSRETGGTGLGLAIAKHAAQFHHGTISVTSTLGQGSTFEVELPDSMN